MNNKLSTSLENVTPESSLTAFYHWLLTDSREHNNILSLFEYKNGNLYLRRKNQDSPEETLEMIFDAFQQGRSDDRYVSVPGQENMMDIFRRIFLDYYDTPSLVNPGEAIEQEIAQVVPFIKQCLQKLIAEELGKQKKDIPFEDVPKSVIAITDRRGTVEG